MQGNGGRRGRRVHHYMQRTVACSAPEFSNQEQDIIRQSFSAGNHTWMKQSLPVELGPDSVHQLRRQRMEQSRLAEPLPHTWSKMTQLWGGGCMQEFEYIPEEYDRQRALLRSQRAESAQRRGQISQSDWRHTSQEKRMKHEALIADPRVRETYPYLGGDKDQELNTSAPSWLRNGSSLGAVSGGATSGVGGQAAASSFLAGKGSGLSDGSRGSRMTLPTIVKRLQGRLEKDWEDTTVIVSATEQDLVQVAFDASTVDSERGVSAYMSVLSKDPELLGPMGLCKVSQLWGLKRSFAESTEISTSHDALDESDEDHKSHTWIFYLLVPKWVRMRPTDAFYTAHPRSRGSAFCMSTAGSSVLLSLGASAVDPLEASLRRSQATTPRGTWGKAADGANARTPREATATGAWHPPERIELSAIEQAVATLPALRSGSG
eukprot:TRINITY_DN47070_c0_g1_i1.p1 TRINITY_DN47070_c0_g1~~TRINITY_DN47070_c0_g1_i1.p1  ORF type:complete len:434 (-),score=86.29 TRINITY_DN47070_c0_g1_i1:43-1344(-)